MSEGKANAIPLYMQAGEELNRSMAEVVFKVVSLSCIAVGDRA